MPRQKDSKGHGPQSVCLLLKGFLLNIHSLDIEQVVVDELSANTKLSAVGEKINLHQ